MRRIGQALLGGLVLGCMFVVSGSAWGVDPDPAVKKIFDKMVDALKTGDKDAFTANASDQVKKGVTDEVMAGLTKEIGARLKKGYEATYLCQLKQADHQVHLWKVTFKDGGDDVVFRLALKDGKVGGFFLQ
ncbi:MAG TPA: hypothetical protein VFE62_15625 [Gemmataceae bacterium]|nr:hypothetical protein [Gemmataceae bacterium]